MRSRLSHAKRTTLRIEPLENRQMLSGAPPVVFTASGGADFTLWQDYVDYGLPAGPSAGWDKEQISFYNYNWGVARSSGTIAGPNATVEVTAEDQNVSVHWSDKGTESFITLNVYVRDDLNQSVPFVIDASESFSVFNNGNDSVRWAGVSGSHSAGGSASRQFTGNAVSVATFGGVQYRLARSFGYYAGVITAFGVPASGQSGEASGTSSIYAYINRGEKPQVEIDAPTEASRGESVRLDSTAWDPDNGPKADGNGITYYRWEITTPSGSTLVREGADLADLDMAFEEIGQHDVTLTVYDDEGMSGSANGAIDVTSGTDVAVVSVSATTVPVSPPDGSYYPDYVYAKDYSRFAVPPLAVNWQLRVSAVLENRGPVDARDVTTVFYLSRDAIIGDAGDIAIGSTTTPIIGEIPTVVSLTTTANVESLLGANGDYTVWNGQIYVGAVATSSPSTPDEDSSNNQGNTPVLLADAVPSYRVIAENLTHAQAVRMLRRMGFGQFPLATPLLEGEDYWTRALGNAGGKKFVSPSDGVSRGGASYRQHGILRRDPGTGSYSIIVQGTPELGEPNPYFAIPGSPWFEYVRNWHVRWF